MAEKKPGKLKSFANEFKEFIAKGNVLDMAVAVIIGGAFGKIVTSLVNDIIMPAVGILTGKVNFADLKYVITAADEAAGVAESAICWGAFIQNIVDFLIVALCIFIMLKIVLGMKTKLEALKKKEEEEANAEEPPKPTSEALLTEIRDLLKNKND